ncbi:aspartate/glutamate racemase family protein [Streptomyces sp. MB09-02B]|uniref:aspartate/glutamate racemase family protein n=1 Tax=Streptomyces sp. MB09-02B TaxID=3028667 RepID=UPI0029A8F2E1|nr:aspartate/glutamate racemase family protein [Streptomyces sp. MB09-02B]MDX3640501.1 aspartate/glutamate racemase family protein [Streptomyces sp. MB09-02B]
MSTSPKAAVLPLDENRANPFGPSLLEHRTAQAGFTELGCWFMDFTESGHADAWTLEYEESVYVIQGQALLRIVTDGAEEEIAGAAGELIALPKGTTVRYGGTAGTRLLLSMAPVNWRELAAAKTEAPNAPRVLFLTPFHFDKPEHDDEFDAVLASMFDGQGDQSVTARHVERFESGGGDYDTTQTQAVLTAVERANAEGTFDAIVIACHYDPAVREAREASRIPVVGPLQLTTALATQFGPKFAVVTDLPEAVPVIRGLIDDYGRGTECAGVTAIGWEGDAILEDPRGAAEAVDRIVADLAAAGEAQSVVIGCTIVSAAYERYRHEFPDRGVVVLNSNLVTVKGAAALAAN